MISSLLHLVGLRPRVYYTLTNFRGGGPRPPWPPPQYAIDKCYVFVRIHVCESIDMMWGGGGGCKGLCQICKLLRIFRWTVGWTLGWTVVWSTTLYNRYVEITTCITNILFYCCMHSIFR